MIGIGVAVAECWPRISIEPTASADELNPFTGYMKVTNEQFYTITDVSIEAFSWCVKIGLGSDTSPVDRCERSMPSSTHRWLKRRLGPHEPYEITPGDVLLVTPPTALLYAQISISVRYEPWFLPLHFDKEMRFESRKRKDGRIEWLHIPLN
jgi:hypothetical protein